MVSFAIRTWHTTRSQRDIGSGSRILREQLKLSHAHQQELHADLLAAEHERERLVSTLGESDKKRKGAKARCVEAEVIVSILPQFRWPYTSLGA
jgi:hypothetical protein